MGQPWPLFHLFSVFSNKQNNFYNKSMYKMSCPSSIWHRDSSPQPLENESSPITTRPGVIKTLMFFQRGWFYLEKKVFILFLKGYATILSLFLSVKRYQFGWSLCLRLTIGKSDTTLILLMRLLLASKHFFARNMSLVCQQWFSRSF